MCPIIARLRSILIGAGLLPRRSGRSTASRSIPAGARRHNIGAIPQSDWYSDTDPRALEVFLECQRRMSASEKVHGMVSLTRMVFETAKAEVRRQHPGIDEQEVFLRTAARHLDRETMKRVYGWDPESADA